MDAKHLAQLLAEAIAEIETKCGRSQPEVRPDLRPVVDLDGWDSLIGLEATALVEEKLGQELDCDSLFVTDSKRPRARTIEEIVALLAKQSQVTREGAA